MHTVEFIRSEDGDWTDLYINGAHASGGRHSPNRAVAEALVEHRGLAVSVPETFRQRGIQGPSIRDHNEGNDV